MSLSNFHVDGNKSDAEVLTRSKKLWEDIVPAFRQYVANGNIKIGGVTLKDGDLNRIHSIVSEIDTRRVFYSCGEDEIADHSFKSVQEARKEIRTHAKGVWATPLSETFVQHIQKCLADYCSKLDKLDIGNIRWGDPAFTLFLDATMDLRLNVWLLVAMLKANVGDIIRPLNLPEEIYDQVTKQNQG